MQCICQAQCQNLPALYAFHNRDCPFLSTAKYPMHIMPVSSCIVCQFKPQQFWYVTRASAASIQNQTCFQLRCLLPNMSTDGSVCQTLSTAVARLPNHLLTPISLAPQSGRHCRTAGTPSTRVALAVNKSYITHINAAVCTTFVHELKSRQKWHACALYDCKRCLCTQRLCPACTVRRC